MSGHARYLDAAGGDGEDDPVKSEAPDDGEIRWLLRRVERAAADQPSKAASDGEWDAWAAVDELLSIVTGAASQVGDGRRPRDTEAYAAAAAALASQEVRELVGERRVAYFERLVELRYARP